MENPNRNSSSFLRPDGQTQKELRNLAKQTMGKKTKASERKTKMELGMRMARHSILKQINNNGCQKNMVFSPLSLHMALNMLASASTGRTLQQLLRFLESNSISDLSEQTSLFMELIATSDKRGDPTISLVNGIWLNHFYPVKPSFKHLAEDVYKAKAESVDFVNQAQKVADEINCWAKESTKGKIDTLVDSGCFTEDDVAVLASAVYFNASWAAKFDTVTGEEDFHLLNGETVRVPFMKSHSGLYGQFEGFQLLKMPYRTGSDGKKYAMYVFLPDKKDGIQEMVHKFHADPSSFLDKWEVERVALYKLWMPKLKFDYEWKVKDNMKELGLDLLFDDKEAEITEMVETSDVVHVSDAFQKSYIEVNEEGTTAASITAIRIRGGGGGPDPSWPSFVADHPFLFMIKEDISGTVLFLGVVLNPLSETYGAGKKRKTMTTSTEEDKKKQR